MAEDKNKASYPMIPESNWWSMRNQFSKTLPSTVSVNYLKTLLALATDQAARNILSPLKSLGILDDDGHPTDLANLWRTDSTYGKTCETMLNAIYPPELLELFPDKDFDKSKVKEWFKATAKLGDSAANKATSLFTLLKSGEIKSTSGSAQSPAKKTKSEKKTPTQKGQRTEKDITSGKEGFSAPIAPITVASNKLPQMTMHIDLQIHISPEASTEQIDAIFASMAKHLYK